VISLYEETNADTLPYGCDLFLWREKPGGNNGKNVLALAAFLSLFPCSWERVALWKNDWNERSFGKRAVEMEWWIHRSVEQCRKNAQAKSDKKCQATLEALAALKKKGASITKTAVGRQAGVSVVFVSSHPDLVQVIAALRRQVEDLKRELSLKEMAFSEKQREIDPLCGKPAA
jgi:hypothetical protein